MSYSEQEPPFSRPELEHPQRGEVLNPRHFYAAYIYDEAQEYQQDITLLVTFAQQLKYPVRYWWLSEAMDIGEDSDRLIVCVHHTVQGEDAGLDLYNAIKEYDTRWVALEAATVEEYSLFGTVVESSNGITHPDGSPLFPRPILDSHQNETVTLISVPELLFQKLLPSEREAFEQYLSLTNHVLLTVLEEKEVFDEAGLGLEKTFSLISEHMRVVSRVIALLVDVEKNPLDDDVVLPF